jgi:hypothetical protein
MVSYRFAPPRTVGPLVHTCTIRLELTHNKQGLMNDDNLSVFSSICAFSGPSEIHLQLLENFRLAGILRRTNDIL